MFGDTVLVREFVRRPTVAGAIAPSSHQLAEAVVAPIPARGDPVVVELGPGTGAFSRLIQDRLDGRGRHIAVEINPRLAEVISRRHPAVEVAETECRAADLDPRARGHRRGRGNQRLAVDRSPRGLRDATLDGVSTVLAPGGVFTTFGYTWVRNTARARRFRRALVTRFEEVVTGRVVVRNLPPAFAYHARRPPRGFGGTPGA
jgi:phospholipid N-methyltransferase